MSLHLAKILLEMVKKFHAEVGNNLFEADVWPFVLSERL